MSPRTGLHSSELSCWWPFQGAGSCAACCLPRHRQAALQQCMGHSCPGPASTRRKGQLFHTRFPRGVKRTSCCGQPPPVPWWPEGSSHAGTRAVRSAHEPICNSRLQGGDIPAPGEGSLAQLMPVASILCRLTQGGEGQPAASPGAWKMPRCQCWCENGALCPSTAPAPSGQGPPFPPPPKNKQTKKPSQVPHSSAVPSGTWLTVNIFLRKGSAVSFKPHLRY